MAKIKFGMMMTDARGKLGGQVFSKNRSGAYVRTKVTPVNPRTTFQQDNRALLGTLSAGWSGLNEEQRSAWNTQVEQWQKTNVFGDLQKPTGKNLFTGLNKVRAQLFPTLPLMVVPPSKAEMRLYKVVSATYSVTTGFMNIVFSGSEITGMNVQVRATPPVTAGTNYVNNLLRSISPVASIPVTGSLGVGAEYIERFGYPVVGQKIFIEVREALENGQLGTPFLILLSIVA